MCDSRRFEHRRARALGTPQIAFKEGESCRSNQVHVERGRRQLVARSWTGVHRPLRVGRDEDQAAACGRRRLQRLRLEPDTERDHVGKRWSTDDNAQNGGSIFPTTFTNNAGLPVDLNGRTHAYNLVDLDARISMKEIGLPAIIRLNLSNVFDKYYFGNITTASSPSTSVRYSVGAPRTFQAGLELNF